MEDRLARVRRRMAEEDFDQLVVSAPENVLYLTNFANFIHERPFLLVVDREGPLRFLMPRLERPHVEARAVGRLDLVPYREFPAPAGETWAETLRSLLASGGRVGVEPVCPLQVAEAIPGEAVATDLLEDVRMIKSAYEVGRLRYGCELVSEAHARLLAGARPGVTLPEIASAASRWMMARILEDEPSTNMLATRLTAVFQPPAVSHDPHNFTDLAMAMEPGGPHVSVVNCVVNGYGAEVERTFFLGRVPEAARGPFETMLEARRLALELTVPGADMSAVDRRVRDVFERAGYGSYLLHRTGHGLGVTGHEGPYLAEGYERTVEPGMVFTVEPGIYLPGVGGFRHSDTVLVTEEGGVLLTRGPVELDEVTLPITG